MAKKLDLLSEGGIYMSLKTTCLHSFMADVLTELAWNRAAPQSTGLKLVRMDFRLWLASRKNPCQFVKRHRANGRNYDWYRTQKFAWGWIHCTACMHATATKPSLPNTLIKHETRKKSPLCFNVSPLPLTDKTQPQMSWHKKESVQHLAPFSENKAVRDWFGAGSNQLLNTQGDHATTTGWLYKALAFHICPTSSENGTKVYLQNLL